MTFRNLARLWRASGDAGVPAGWRALGVTPAEAEALLRRFVDKSGDE
ncbi:MAG: hypothetical protein HZY76_03780 [Anaerolineae bacterium]|nr:MAG: hypothetical protein HZY76_03780 [Anaerolineae bacterium]